jgi:glycosyltransferase involved in cell wall biosynthesis
MKRRLLILWPNQRRENLEDYQKNPGSRPEPLDGLGILRDFGYELEFFEVNKFPINPGARRGSLWQGLDPLRALRQILQSRRFDAIVCIGDSSAAIYLAWSNLWLTRTPVVLIDPALDVHYRPRIKLQGFVLPRCSHVVVYGSNQCEHLRLVFGNRVRTSFVHHRIDTDFYRRVSPRRPDSRPCVVSIGDDKTRDFETVYEVARGINADFIIKTRNPPPIQAPSNVRVITERISFASLRDLYENADLSIVSIQPTIHASGVTSLLESMAMSVPTIVTDNAALADYTQAGKTCALVPPGDVEAMRSSVEAMLHDPVLSEAVGVSGRLFVETTCALPRYASKLDGILSSAIAGNVSHRSQAPA